MRAVIRRMVAVTAALAFLHSCWRAPTSKSTPAGRPVEQRRALTQWFYADGRILPDDGAPRSPDGARRSPAREWLVVANLSRRTVRFTATFYFEDMGPRSFTRIVAARRSQSFALHEMPDVVLPGKLYGARVKSDGPILVQPTRGEYEPSNPVTEAMSSFLAYPGPLGARETKWAYADGLILDDGSPLQEREWVSILNPNSEGDARVRIRLMRSGRESEYWLTVAAERVRTVELHQLKAFQHNALTGVIVESDRPVVVEQIRRAFAKGAPVTASLWATLAHPIGDQEIP